MGTAGDVTVTILSGRINTEEPELKTSNPRKPLSTWWDWKGVFFYCYPNSYKEHIFSSLYGQEKNVPGAILPLKIKWAKAPLPVQRPCRHPWAPFGLLGLRPASRGFLKDT